MEPFILKLLSKLPEVYQDVLIGDKTVAKGKRDVEARWNLFKHLIKPHDVVIDLGSSLGYYSKKIATTYPDSLVLSFESDPDMCEVQRQMFKKEGIYNVIVCNHRLSCKDMVDWSAHAEMFDVILALAVLHHYPEDCAQVAWGAIKSLAPLVIGEVPNPREKEACGGETKKFTSKLLENVESLGTTKSHLGEYERALWYKRTHPLRTNTDAFFGVSHEDRHRFKVEYNDEWLLNGKHIIKGVNVWNLLHFNVVWPPPTWWQDQAKAAYRPIPEPTDIRPWNLLVTSTGLKAIDYTTEFPEGDKAAYSFKDFTKLNNMFINMKPEWE